MLSDTEVCIQHGSVTCREEGDAGIGPMLPHLVRQHPWDGPEVQVGRDPTGLNGHQVTTNTYTGEEHRQTEWVSE